MTKRKKRDPLAALKKKHPGPWKASKFSGVMIYYCVYDANGTWIAETYNPSLARAIAKLGAK